MILKEEKKFKKSDYFLNTLEAWTWVLNWEGVPDKSLCILGAPSEIVKF